MRSSGIDIELNRYFLPDKSVMVGRERGEREGGRENNQRRGFH